MPVIVRCTRVGVRVEQMAEHRLTLNALAIEIVRICVDFIPSGSWLRWFNAQSSHLINRQVMQCKFSRVVHALVLLHSPGAFILAIPTAATRTKHA
jgi:hypothetical protein